MSIMTTTRRWVLCSLIVGFAGCLENNDVVHRYYVWVYNNHDTEHDVSVVTKIDNDEHDFGPYSVVPSEEWEVVRHEASGPLAIEFVVDGEVAWESDDLSLSEKNAGRSIGRGHVVFAIDEDGSTDATFLAEN